MDEEAFYTVLRFCPDIMRGEFATVGILLATRSHGLARTLQRPSAIFRALGPSSSGLALDKLGDHLTQALEAAQRNAASPKDVLLHVISDGFPGFGYSDPASVLFDPAAETERAVLDGLYQDFVEPRTWARGRSLPQGHRVETILRTELLPAISRQAHNIASGLVIRSDVGTIKLPLAYANGTPTFVQAVDLDVTREYQEWHTQNAIAQVATTEGRCAVQQSAHIGSRLSGATRHLLSSSASSPSLRTVSYISMS